MIKLQIDHELAKVTKTESESRWNILNRAIGHTSRWHIIIINLEFFKASKWKIFAAETYLVLKLLHITDISKASESIIRQFLQYADPLDTMIRIIILT